MGQNLTNLNLSHNRLACIPQLITSLSVKSKSCAFSLWNKRINREYSYFFFAQFQQENCPNLSLLDLSNVTTVAASHGILHIEQLQDGCPKLKVLRITNSQITLGPPPTTDRAAVPNDEVFDSFHAFQYFHFTPAFSITLIVTLFWVGRIRNRLAFGNWKNYPLRHWLTNLD